MMLIKLLSGQRSCRANKIIHVRKLFCLAFRKFLILVFLSFYLFILSVFYFFVAFYQYK